MCWTIDDLNKIKLRNPEIFEKIYLRYKTKVYNFFLIKTKGNKDIANELLCDTFYSAFKSAVNLKNTKNILAWLLQIAYRRLMDYFRRQFNEKEKIHSFHDEGDIKHDPYSNIDTNEEILLFNIAFDKLSDIHKKVLTLKYIEDKSQKEIAVIINKTEKAVEGILSRSKNLIKKEFKKNKRLYNE